MHPAFISCAISLVIEVPVCVFLSLWGMEAFAYYLSDSTEVALITKKMWKVSYPRHPTPNSNSDSSTPYALLLTNTSREKNIDWCYIFYALQYQLSAILLATNPRWYLYQALGSNLLWMLPWAIVVTEVRLSEERAWTFYAIIFGGALVFSFLNVGVTLGIWAWRLARGKISLRRVHSTL